MKIKLITGVIAFAMAFASCANEESVNTESEEVTTEETSAEEVEQKEVMEETVTEEPEIVSKYQYDKDWEIIKEAILNQDIPGLGAWAGSDAFDAEMFMMMAQEEWVIEALNQTSYDLSLIHI